MSANIFWKKLQKTNDFSAQPTIGSPVIDELCNIQYLFKNSEMNKDGRPENPHILLMGFFLQVYTYPYTIFSQLTVSDTVTLPQSQDICFNKN